jgi:hypothetical protein
MAPMVALAILVIPGPAHAYRPFDETDADVAEKHVVELELGPVGYTHDDYGGTLTPGFILNYGLVNRVELVFDAHHALLFRGVQLGARRPGLDTALTAKVVVREGCLQGETGVSVALEGGALLPTIPSAGGAGASFAAIVSQRWTAATLHINLETDLPRDGGIAFIGGSILEGPFAWTVRPVAETFVAHETASSTIVSGLAGAIWRVDHRLSIDAAVRAARDGGLRIYEARSGLTLDFDI